LLAFIGQKPYKGTGIPVGVAFCGVAQFVLDYKQLSDRKGGLDFDISKRACGFLRLGLDNKEWK
jgi:hypothetical protein